MVKSVLDLSHQGLTDWLIQRVSAIVMVIYTIGMLVFCFMHTPMTFNDWHELFSHLWIKVSTLLVLLALLYHAWIGMWTIFTDYVKPYVLRLVFHVVVLLALVAFFIEGALILWGV